MTIVVDQGSKSYCLVTSGAVSLAFGMDVVEAVIEATRTVRVPLCRDPVLALCPYRGGTLPIVGLGDGAGVHVPDAENPPTVVLVLRTRKGTMGLEIERGSLSVVRGFGAASPPALASQEHRLPAGLVATESIEWAGRRHPVIDLDRTWEAMRGMIEACYEAGLGGAARACPPSTGGDGRSTVGEGLP